MTRGEGPLTGRWRIVEMDMCDRDDIDLVEPGFIEFGEDGLGQFGFVAVRGQMDCRDTARDGHECVEFTWEGADEGDQVSGRGWARSTGTGELEGHFYFHLGDDAGFRAVHSPDE